MKDEIALAVQQGKTIRIKSYAMVPQTNQQIRQILEETLSYYGKSNLVSALFAAIKELSINAVKANIKRIIFEKNGLDIDNHEDYNRGLSLLKKKIESSTIETHARDCKDHGYAVWIDFIYGQEHFMVEVKNNALISETENARVREKLFHSMRFEDLIEFYNHFADEEEGAGLGMTLVTIALRKEGINPRCFSIFSQDGLTTARLEIPIGEKYISRRDQFNIQQISVESSDGLQ